MPFLIICFGNIQYNINKISINDKNLSNIFNLRSFNLYFLRETFISSQLRFSYNLGSWDP